MGAQIQHRTGHHPFHFEMPLHLVSTTAAGPIVKVVDFFVGILLEVVF